jgi:predicted dehydrogenase
MTPIRVAVIGAGAFGRNHARIIGRLPAIQLAAVVDSDLDRARAVAVEHNSKALSSAAEAIGACDAAIVATPTETHERIASELIEAGIDVLVEKPVAQTAAAGERMAALARKHDRILQVGHLERFNPAVSALEQALTVPLFFEIHRLSVFTARSLDVDVVLDLMIHDLDIVLSFTGEVPDEVRAAGISVLSSKVDIANVRLAFPSGCIANLTASRVSTERVRKLRLFQPGEYFSLDYQRQDAVRISVSGPAGDGGLDNVGFGKLPVQCGEPLEMELLSFFECVRTRANPKVDGVAAARALGVAELIIDKMKEHAELVARTLRGRKTSAGPRGQPSPF